MNVHETVRPGSVPAPDKPAGGGGFWDFRSVNQTRSIVCFSIGAAIGAPGLIDGNWLYGTGTREDLFDTVSRGRSGICPAFVHELSPVTIRALAVLIYTNSHKGPAKTAAQSGGPMAGAGG